MPHQRAAVVPSEAMTLQRARALLGRDADGLTDTEVLDVCQQAAVIAQAIVQMFLESTRAERPM